MTVANGTTTRDAVASGSGRRYGMARTSTVNDDKLLNTHSDDLVRRLRKAPVDRVLCQVTDPQTARDFWDLVQEVLERDDMSRSTPG